MAVDWLIAVVISVAVILAVLIIVGVVLLVCCIRRRQRNYISTSTLEKKKNTQTSKHYIRNLEAASISSIDKRGSTAHGSARFSTNKSAHVRNHGGTYERNTNNYYTPPWQWRYAKRPPKQKVMHASHVSKSRTVSDPRSLMSNSMRLQLIEHGFRPKSLRDFPMNGYMMTSSYSAAMTGAHHDRKPIIPANYNRTSNIYNTMNNMTVKQEYDGITIVTTNDPGDTYNYTGTRMPSDAMMQGGYTSGSLPAGGDMSMTGGDTWRITGPVLTSGRAADVTYQTGSMTTNTQNLAMTSNYVADIPQITQHHAMTSNFVAAIPQIAQNRAMTSNFVADIPQTGGTIAAENKWQVNTPVLSSYTAVKITEEGSSKGEAHVSARTSKSDGDVIGGAIPMTSVDSWRIMGPVLTSDAVDNLETAAMGENWQLLKAKDMLSEPTCDVPEISLPNDQISRSSINTAAIEEALW